jgi:hypothetical protein
LKIKTSKDLFGDITHDGIINSNDYSKAVAAYLMSGSKAGNS